MLNLNKTTNFSQFIPTETWIFDLDNTLYPAESQIFHQIDRRMNQFIMNFLDMEEKEAAMLRREYYLQYGSTLAGLMRNHGANPEPFLDYVHDLDLSAIQEAPELGRTLQSLPGRKFIFTNGSRHHAERVVGKLGVVGRFDDVFDIAAAGFTPKPHPEAYQRFLDRLDVAPRAAAMFEDLPSNLESPHELGMRTVLVQSCKQDHPSLQAMAESKSLPAHIHYITDDLVAFLDAVLKRIGAEPAATVEAREA
jgi:putative hydrolase of the HAD superfamily